MESKAVYPLIDKILTQALHTYGDEVEIRDYRISDYLFVKIKTRLHCAWPLWVRLRLGGSACAWKQ